MSKELKPCPFCGGKLTRRYFSKETEDGYEYAYVFILCSTFNCGGAMMLRIPAVNEWTEEEGALKLCTERWNRRAGDD